MRPVLRPNHGSPIIRLSDRLIVCYNFAAVKRFRLGPSGGGRLGPRTALSQASGFPQTEHLSAHGSGSAMGTSAGRPVVPSPPGASNEAQLLPSLAIHPLAVASGARCNGEVSEWAAARPGNCLCSSIFRKTCEKSNPLGRDESSVIIEKSFGAIAQRLVAFGVRCLLVAGGETSRAVVSVLGVDGLQIEAAIVLGVVWTMSLGHRADSAGAQGWQLRQPGFLRKAFEVPPWVNSRRVHGGIRQVLLETARLYILLRE